ncbi:dihydrolipoyl dehydrogenase family protein [Oceanibacterium hippocampi]|uniref:Mercuric reductase n=1 Tax=Oceanibacterium hippocampi TaxID=745714 RepID=A0A1Y5U2R7_9PROT|nr:NAD(P)/FAD-dependent oxidoreductase [Oceanibacterium hippocampi]SLN75431.1 Mercuric reductase [Oceanibacterium hippocampi]
MVQSFDTIIIGGGNAGFGASAILHEAGRNIAFVEERDFGGTCPNRGCTPKKVLVAAAQAMHGIERAPVHGIEVGKARLDWARLIDRKHDLISDIPGAMLETAEKRGTVFRGKATFAGPDRIRVDGRTIAADNIVIATGSKPRPLPIPGAEHMITSDEVLTERDLPGEVIFIGGGVIAMEFAHVYARAGAKVTILEATPRLLPAMDADAVAILHRETERLGVTVETGVEVKEITRAGDGLSVAYERDGNEHALRADRVVNGAGRIANVGELDLDAADIAHDEIRIDVDDFLRSTSNPSVWVAGDSLVGSAQLSPLATYEGRIVGQNIVHGPVRKPDYTVIPSAVYTVPALSAVGLTEAEAGAAGIKVKAKTVDMTDWLAARTHAETVAWSKVLVEEKSDRIVGAHMIGHHGEDLIHLFALAMRHGITATELQETLFAFPTFSADLKSVF